MVKQNLYSQKDMKEMRMKTKNPMVSIILPTHNGAKTIGDSIQSVIHQDFEDFELIIVVDGSTDNTMDIIEQNKDNRVYVISLHRNSQICFALNKGIEQARGKYIARIDDDDIWEANKLSKQISFLENNPEYGACFSWVSIIDSKGNQVNDSPVKELFRQPNRMRRDWVRHLFNELSCLCHPTVVITKEALEEVGYYNLALMQLQDFELWLRIVKRYPIYIIQEELVKYRWDPQHKKSISTRDKLVDFRSAVEYTYVLSHCLDDIGNEEFVKIFSLDFVMKTASTPEELAIERALLMFLETNSNRVDYTRNKGIALLADVLNNERVLDVFTHKYGLTQMSVYELSAGKSIEEVLGSDENRKS